jgi:hypothetical protein
MKFRQYRPLLASIALSIGVLFPTVARASTHPAVRLDTRVTVSFRLHVAGQPAQNSTFWVAYGPVAGKFGLVQLKSSGSGTFVASRRMPASARLDLSYLAGHGVTRTRFGAAPGNPVTTIRHIAPVPVAGGSLPIVQWQAPIG